MENRPGFAGMAEQTRRLKTPWQVQELEKVYSVSEYPSEATKSELSKDLGLSQKQVQRWFRHRRLKEKKGNKKEDPDGIQQKELRIDTSTEQKHYHQPQIFKGAEKPKSACNDTTKGSISAPHDFCHGVVASTSQDSCSFQYSSGAKAPINECHSDRKQNFCKKTGQNNSPSFNKCQIEGYNLRCSSSLETSDTTLPKEIMERNTHDYPSAVLAEEITDHEILNGESSSMNELCTKNYLRHKDKSSSPLDTSFQIDTRGLPSIDLSTYNRKTSLKRFMNEYSVVFAHPLKRREDIEQKVVSSIKAQLGRFYRSDGPPLDIEFDPLPPGGFLS